MRRLLLLLLLPFVPAQAIYYCCPNYCFNPCYSWTYGKLQLSAEAFYAKPHTCDLDFVIQDPRPPSSATADFLPQGKNIAVRPEYEWAPRILVTYVVPGGCVDFSGIYTGFHHSNKRCIFQQGDGGLWPVNVNPLYMGLTPLFSGNVMGEAVAAYAKGRSRYDFDSGELQFALRGPLGSRVCTRIFAAVHIMQLNQYLDSEFFGLTFPVLGAQLLESASLHNKQKVWGVGPKVGFDAHLNLWCGFGVGGKIAAAVLAGRSCGHLWQGVEISSGVDETMDISEMKFGRVFPQFETRLGIDYTYCWCASLWHLEIGYQFISYINLLCNTSFNDQRATSVNRPASFNLDGLYIRLSLQI
ncbi:MAG: Lpg1974 family pore-forming outer membrane protein [Parachlamydiales bacterium]